jgi:hypothetical protein
VLCSFHRFRVSPSISASAQPPAVSSASCCADIEHDLLSTLNYKFLSYCASYAISCIKPLYSLKERKTFSSVFLKPEFEPPCLSVRESASMSFGYSSYWLSLAFTLLAGFCQPSAAFPLLPASVFQVSAFGISSFPPTGAFTLPWLQRSSAWTIETTLFHTYWYYLIVLFPFGYC